METYLEEPIHNIATGLSEKISEKVSRLVVDIIDKLLEDVKYKHISKVISQLEEQTNEIVEDLADAFDEDVLGEKFSALLINRMEIWVDEIEKEIESKLNKAQVKASKPGPKGPRKPVKMVIKNAQMAAEEKKCNVENEGDRDEDE